MMSKYGFRRKGRPNFDTALHYITVDMIPTEKTRIPKARTVLPGVRLAKLWGSSPRFGGTIRAVGRFHS